MAEQYDVVIIGGGPGGCAAALYGASAGLSIAMVEKGKVGGTCLHRGCIPAKELLETAHVYRTVKEAATFGIGTGGGEPTVDFATTMDRKQKVVDQLWKGLQGLIKARKITTYIGTGTYKGGGNVSVDDGTELTADAVAKSFSRRGIEVRTGVKVTGHTPGDSTTRIHLEGSDDLEVERVVVSVGRRPLSDGLGLEGTGVEVDERGFVKIDETSRTTVD